MNNLKNSEKGFIREIVLIVVVLVSLKYFWNIDVIGYLTEGPLASTLNWIAGKYQTLFGN